MRNDYFLFFFSLNKKYLSLLEDFPQFKSGLGGVVGCDYTYNKRKFWKIRLASYDRINKKRNNKRRIEKIRTGGVSTQLRCLSASLMLLRLVQFYYKKRKRKRKRKLILVKNNKFEMENMTKYKT